MIYDMIDFEILASVCMDFISVGAYVSILFALAHTCISFLIKCFTGKY